MTLGADFLKPNQEISKRHGVSSEFVVVDKSDYEIVLEFFRRRPTLKPVLESDIKEADSKIKLDKSYKSEKSNRNRY